MITFSEKAAVTLPVMPSEELGRRATVTRLAPVIAVSIVTYLNGLPYPVQYRNQDAIAGWQRELGMSETSRKFWQCTAQPGFTCQNAADAFEHLFGALIQPKDP